MKANSSKKFDLQHHNLAVFENTNGSVSFGTKQAINLTISENAIGAFRWFFALGCDYSIALTAFLLAYSFGWKAYPFSLLLLGIAQHRIAILGHDGSHGLICKGKKLNYWITQVLCFWPLLTDINSYKKFHWEHHKHTGNTNTDPELILKEDRYHLPITYTQLFSRFIMDFFGWSIREFIQVSAFIARKSNPLWALSFISVAFAVSYYFGHFEFFILFMLSKPTAFWAVFRLRIYTEHVGVDDTHRVHLGYWQRALFSPHNAWMHWEHHKHPQVPFWKLPEIRAQYKQVPIIEFDELLRRGEVYQEKELAFFN